MSYCTCEPLTEKLLSCLTTVKGFPSLLICFAFIFCRVMTFIRYFGINFTYGLLDCVRYTEDFVISRFCFIHFTVTLAEMKNIVLYKLQCKKTPLSVVTRNPRACKTASESIWIKLEEG